MINETRKQTKKKKKKQEKGKKTDDGIIGRRRCVPPRRSRLAKNATALGFPVRIVFVPFFLSANNYG